MSDIMDRLRQMADLFEAQQAPHNMVLHLRAAADEIERLRAALEEAAQIAERKAAALSLYRDTHAAVQAAIAEDIAAEIRALIPRRSS
jgi:hypothetical protein